MQSIYIWSVTCPDYDDRMKGMANLFSFLKKHDADYLLTCSLSLVPKV